MTVKPKHTNPSRYINELMKERGLSPYTPIHIYSLIKKFQRGEITQRTMETYNVWLEMKEEYSNWDNPLEIPIEEIPARVATPISETLERFADACE